MYDFKSPRTYLRALLVQALRDNDANAIRIYTQANGVKGWFVRAHNVDQIASVVAQLTRAVAPLGYKVSAAHKQNARGRSIYILPDHMPSPEACAGFPLGCVDPTCADPAARLSLLPPAAVVRSV